MSVIQTGSSNVVRARVRPKILSGAWISMDFKETEYDPSDPYVGTDGNSLKLEHTCIGDKVLIRIKTRGIPDNVKVAHITVKEDDFLFDDTITDKIRANRVKIDDELTDVFEAEIELTKDYYTNGTNNLTDNQVTEYLFIAKIEYREDNKDVKVEKSIDEVLKIDLENFIITLCPRSRANLFAEPEEGTDNNEAEEDYNRIKEVLEEFKKAEDSKQPFKKNKLFEDYKEVFKEMEYHFYMQFSQNIGVAGNYASKKISVLLENKYKNEADGEDTQGRLKDKMVLKLTKESGSDSLRFLDRGQLVEELELEVKPDENDSTKNAVAEFTIAHPLTGDEIEDGDKEIKLKAALKGFDEIFQEIVINLKRNEDITLKDIGIDDSGNSNTLEEANGFWARELVVGVGDDNDFSTYNEEIRDKLQMIVVFDLDRRDSGEDGARNGVDGYFRMYENDSDNLYDTARSLNDFIGTTGNAACLKGSVFNGDRPFGELDIDTNLKDYLENEYGYEYRTDSMIGEVIDKNILVGENNNNSDPASIDGLLEILQYNKNNIEDININNVVQTDSGDANVTSDFETYIHQSNGSSWYHVTDYSDTEIIEETLHTDSYPWQYDREGQPPEARRLVRRHEGVDYGRANNPYLVSPLYMKCVRIDDGNDAAHFWPSFNFIGVRETFRFLHLNVTNAIALNYIFYPEERIANFPSTGDGPYARHFHIELWRLRANYNEGILLNPYTKEDVGVANGDNDSDLIDPANSDEHTGKYYLWNFDRLTLNERQLNSVAENTRNVHRFTFRPGHNFNRVFHSQPDSPFEEDN